MPNAGSVVARLFVLLPAILFVMGSLGGQVSAHAEMDSASPPVDGTVTALPSSLTLKFTEEVKPGGVSVQVTGPSGTRVDTGDAAVDLNDPERITVTVSLFAGGPGAYNVHWETISNIDGDSAEGDYSFSVTPPLDTGSPVSAATPVVVISPTPNPDLNGNPLNPDDEFDGQALALSVGAGLLALAAIVGLWFLLRPKNPKLGPRSGKSGE